MPSVSHDAPFSMSPPSRPFALPSEVLCTIISFLLPSDRAALARTCRDLHAFLTPIVWRNIELHHRGVQ